ncbi:MAG: malate synthase G, partial [Nitratireductor sp.]|nr:malate synthase G [Nitratireductor sp.]
MSAAKTAARVKAGSLDVDKKLYDFINKEVLPGTGVREKSFWSGFGKIVNALTPKNRELLARRDELQKQIDQWHLDNPGRHSDLKAYKSFLKKIGYLVPEGKAFSVTTSKVDDELTTIAGPQLVVPVMNARYALN